MHIPIPIPVNKDGANLKPYQNPSPKPKRLPNIRCRTEKTIIVKVIPGGSGHRQLLDEMGEPDWTLPVLVRKKIPTETLAMMDQEDQATAYAVETVVITSEDVIKPSDYPPLPEPTAKEAKDWAPNHSDSRQEKKKKERKEAEWRVRQIAVPKWEDWEMSRGRMRPTANVKHRGLESDARRTAEANEELQMHLTQGAKKLAREEAERLHSLQAVLTADREIRTEENMMAVRSNKKIGINNIQRKYIRVNAELATNICPYVSQGNALSRKEESQRSSKKAGKGEGYDADPVHQFLFCSGQQARGPGVRGGAME